MVDLIEATRDTAGVTDAAQIWALATTARDGADTAPGLDVARPVIQGVLDRSPRSFLLIARSADGAATGFAAIEPRPGGDEAGAQVSYLGVRPRLWGQGIAERLLQELRARLKAAGFTHAELAVYVENVRAIALYERAGWRACGVPTAHPRTGKPEQWYELRL
jgi:ribosomal protein S18 acetylase RimI-like enzyme